MKWLLLSLQQVGDNDDEGTITSSMIGDGAAEN